MTENLFPAHCGKWAGLRVFTLKGDHMFSEKIERELEENREWMKENAAYVKQKGLDQKKEDEARELFRTPAWFTEENLGFDGRSR